MLLRLGLRTVAAGKASVAAGTPGGANRGSIAIARSPGGRARGGRSAGGCGLVSHVLPAGAEGAGVHTHGGEVIQVVGPRARFAAVAKELAQRKLGLRSVLADWRLPESASTCLFRSCERECG